MLLPFEQVCCCQFACAVCCAAQLLALQSSTSTPAVHLFCYYGRANYYIIAGDKYYQVYPSSVPVSCCPQHLQALASL